MNRKINKQDGIIPPNSFLIHPATMRLIKNNKNKDLSNIKNLKTNDFLTPQINVDSNIILKAFDVKYILDIENNFNNITDRNKIRLLKILIKQNKDIRNTKNIPKIINFLQEYYNTNSKDVFKYLLD